MKIYRDNIKLYDDKLLKLSKLLMLLFGLLLLILLFLPKKEIEFVKVLNFNQKQPFYRSYIVVISGINRVASPLFN